MVRNLLVALIAVSVLTGCGSAPVQEAREDFDSSPAIADPVPNLASYTEPRKDAVRDVFIHSPWEPAKYLSLSFPEHCWGNGLPNTSHNNREPMASPWQFNADSTTGWYENEPKPGVIYRARVDADSMAVRLTCTIVNNTDEPLTSIRTLVCMKPDSRRDPAQLANAMTEFGDTCFSRTWIWVNRSPLRLGEDTHYAGDLPDTSWEAEEVNSRVNWGVNVAGGLDNRTIEDIGWFRGRSPGRIVDELADPPLIAVGDKNHADRWLATIWSPSRVLFSNPRNPCFHSDPVVPDCPARDSVSIHGMLFFHQGTLDGLLARADGWLATMKQ